MVLSNKTTKCIRCGKSLKLDRIKILYETESDIKMRHYLGLINAEMDDNLEEFKEKFY